MHDDGVAVVVIGTIALLLLRSLSAVVLRRLRFPYTIGLVIVGLLLAIVPDRLAALQPIRHIQLTPDVVLYLFVPTLIFPAAVPLDPRFLRRNLVPRLLLAGPGVILSAVIVGGIVGAVTPLVGGAALLFGALIAATDPIAAVALFKDLKVPGRLSVLVDGESLLNDAVAVVLFTIVLSAISEVVGPMTLARGAVDFLNRLMGRGTTGGTYIAYAVVAALLARAIGVFRF